MPEVQGLKVLGHFCVMCKVQGCNKRRFLRSLAKVPEREPSTGTADMSPNTLTSYSSKDFLSCVFWDCGLGSGPGTSLGVVLSGRRRPTAFGILIRWIDFVVLSCNVMSGNENATVRICRATLP